MGMWVAGGGYLPVMCDHILMTEGSGLFLAGPALVQAAIGQKYSAEELGGAKMHSQISGTVDFRDHRRIAARGAHQFAAVVHVRSGFCERHGEKIRADLRGETDVLLVFFGERSQRQTAAETIDAFAV